MRKYILSAIAAIGVLFTSCESFFDLERPEAKPWQSVMDLEPVISASYKNVFANGIWSNPISNIIAYTAAQSDAVYLNPSHTQPEMDYYFSKTQNSVGSTQLNGDISNCITYLYASINNSNMVIDFIKEIESGTNPMFVDLSDADLALLERYKGAIYFIRGYAYWMISQSYMPPYHQSNLDKKYIPLILEVRTEQEQVMSPYMGSMREVYAAMESDFKISRECFEESGDSDSFIMNDYRGYANKYASSAMLMRLYFLQNKDTEALSECNYIIDQGPYSLDEQPIRAFNRNAEILYTSKPAADEVIFDAVYTNENQASLKDKAPRLSLITRAGHPNFSNKDITASLADLNWTGGARLEGGADNWMHSDRVSIYWSPSVVKRIGWSDVDDHTSVDYAPNAYAMSDKRFVQLNYFLKGNNGDPNADKSIYETHFPNIKHNIFWGDKYLRAPAPRSSQLPLIRLAEVYLTRATLLLAAGSQQEALDDVNTVRRRAGVVDLEAHGYGQGGAFSEYDIETERLTEMAFEVNDRLLYLVAMERDIPANIEVDGTGAKTNDIAAVPAPYSNLYLTLPDSESFYSGSIDEIK